MTLTRHDAAEVDRLLDHPDGERAGLARLWHAWDEGLGPPELRAQEPPPDEPFLDHIEENDDIRRNWEGLHVLVTGCDRHDAHEDDDPPCGPAPARDVAMGGLSLDGSGSGGRLNTPFLLTPAQVRAVHGFLRDLDPAALIRERAALVADAGVYSFHMGVLQPDGSTPRMSMVEDGSLLASLRGVRDFYARAAAAGNAVIKEIS
ncbi:DUF1877 family protein [Streptomyces sp. G45]|uniref:DUF1877 family protein n=1 Tax=Streptomyces sp. G45 TaxID=3406627 RepID=UPI003C139A91